MVLHGTYIFEMLSNRRIMGLGDSDVELLLGCLS